MSEEKIATLSEIESMPEFQDGKLSSFVGLKPQDHNITMEDLGRQFSVTPETLKTWAERPEDDWLTRQGKGIVAGGARTVQSIQDLWQKGKNVMYRHTFPSSDEEQARKLIELGMRQSINRGKYRASHEHYEGTDDSVAADISAAFASALEYVGVGLIGSALGGGAGALAAIGMASGVQAGVETAEEFAQKYIDETGDYSLKGYDLSNDAIAAGYGAVSGFIESALGIESVLAGGFKKAGFNVAMRKLALGAIEEGSEEFLQEIGRGAAGKIVGLEDRTWDDIAKDALKNAAYGALVGGTLGGNMYYYHRHRLAKRLQERYALTPSEANNIASAVIDEAASQTEKEASTVVALQDHFGTAFDSLVTKVESTLDAAGWDATQIDPKTNQLLDKHEYATTVASDIAFQVLRQAKINHVPVSDVLDLAEIQSIDNVLYLKPQKLGTKADIENTIKEKKAQVKRLTELAKTGAGDPQQKANLKTQIAVLDKLLDRKNAQQKAREDARPQELKDRSNLAKQDAKTLKKSDNVMDFAQKTSTPEKQVTPVEAKKRYDDARLMWLCNDDTNLFESLTEIGSTGTKVISGINNVIDNVYQFAKDNPNLDLRADIQGALERLVQVANRPDFAEFVSAPSTTDVFGQNALLYAFNFGSADDITVFLNNYMDKVNTNKQDGKFESGTFDKNDLYSQCLKMFDSAFDGDVATDPNMRAVMLSKESVSTPEQLTLFQEQIDLADENARLDDIYPAYTGDTIRIIDPTELKQAQYEVIQRTNPMQDEYHVGIRSVNDIKTFDETIDDKDSFVWGDYSQEDAKRDLAKNEITIYSSKPIENGVFVSTSYRQAQEYAGGKGAKVYKKTVPLDYVAWISGDEGQFAITDVVGKKHSVYNSNGERIAQSEPALRNFYNWFGNSKVVDEQGRPLVVYHGTNNNFNIFDKSMFNKTESRGDYVGEGFYFHKKSYSAQKYGKNIIAAYLKLENPIIINNEQDANEFRDSFGKDDKYWDLQPSEIRTKLIERDYDGLIDNLYNQYATFEPNQIKSVDNRGTYSSDTGNIYLQGSKKQGAYDPELQVIIIGKDFNTGTLPHEMAHFWLDDIFRRATTQNDWTPEFAEQANNLFGILGVEEGQTRLTVGQQEKFARMVENVVFGLQPAPAGAELPTLAYLNWIPEKYKSIADIRYKDEDGTYHYPLLDKDAADFFNAWYSNTSLPDIGTSPLEIQNENFTDRNGDVVPSTPEIMKLRDNTQEQAVKDQADVDKEMHDSGVENTPTDTRAEMVAYNTQASREATTPEPVVQPQPKKKSILRIGRGTNTRAEMIEEAQKYIEKNKDHAEEIAFGDPELVENDSGIERGILIREVMNNYKKGSQEYATLYDNLARTMSLAGKTGGLNNDIQVRFYLEGYSRLNRAMEAKAAAKYAGSNRGAITKFNQDIQAFIASKADTILATAPNSKERNDLIDAMIREAEIKFAGGTGDARMLFQENNFGQKAKRQNKADFMKWADKEIKKMLKANPESDPAVVSELITKSEKAQVAMTQLDSTDVNERVAAFKVLRDWQAYTDSLDNTVLDNQISKFNRVFRKIVGSWQPFAMLTNINTHANNLISNTINLGAVESSLYAQYGKSEVSKDLIKAESDRIWAVYNATQIDISQMVNPATPSLLHGEKIDVTANNKLRVLDTRMWLGKEDLLFRSKVYLSTLAHIATKNAKASGKSANELFQEYCKLNQEAGSEAEQARQQAVLMGNIATFTQNGKFSGMLQKVRTEINKFTDPTGKAGFGTMLAPFLKTPANIVELGVRASVAPITDVVKLAKMAMGKGATVWTVQDTLSNIYFVLALIIAAALQDYEPEYEKGKKYNPKKPYDSITFGGDAWFKLDLFGAMETPIRFMAALKTNKGLGISGVVNATPLIGDVAESVSNVERASTSKEKLLNFGINYAYNQVNKSVPAILKQTMNLANLTNARLEDIDIGIKTGIGRKLGRQYGLDAETRTNTELLNDVLGVFFNRLKFTE